MLKKSTLHTEGVNIPPSPLQKGGDAEVVLLKTFWIASVVGVSRYELQARTSGG